MNGRTDLAVESYESNEKAQLEGVKISERGSLTSVEVLNEKGATSLGKPVGNYLTLKVKSFINDTDIFDGRLNDFAEALGSMLPEGVSSVLVAGLGNKNITADSLGPKTGDYILSTRHVFDELKRASGFEGLFCVSSVETGVLGETGIETAEIIKGVAAEINPSCIITVDALADSSTERLGTTVQFSDSGISPGSGVGNHRHEISEKTLGVPVIAIGIPTVVSASVLSGENGGDLYVTPREIDRICEQGAKLIGMGINVCLHKGISAEDLYALVG
ncbi:MAG: GPR endopeptidase [Eubacterium sp.]|nr:GPR endopeptidase [Eubacterium sp.]